MKYIEQFFEWIAQLLWKKFHTNWQLLSSEVRVITIYFCIANLVVIAALLCYGRYYAGPAWLDSKLDRYGLLLTNDIQPKIQFDSRYPRYIQNRMCIVNPSLGWQGFGIRVQGGESYKVSVEGRVHTGLAQIANQMKYAKYMLVHDADRNSELYKTFKTAEYPNPYLDTTFKQAIFRRNWCDINGQDVKDVMLDPAKLYPKGKYGTLLWGVFKANVSDLQNIETLDPYEAVPYSAISPLINPFNPITSIINIPPGADGYLYFIVNDVIASDNKSAQQRSNEVFTSLKRSSLHLKEAFPNEEKMIPEETIPLYFYADNLGSYILTLTPTVPTSKTDKGAWYKFINFFN